MMPKVTETKLTDKNKMNDYNLDQRMSVTIKELRAELQESNLRLDMQVEEATKKLRTLQDKKVKQDNIITALDEMRGDA